MDRALLFLNNDHQHGKATAWNDDALFRTRVKLQYCQYSSDLLKREFSDLFIIPFDAEHSVGFSSGFEHEHEPWVSSNPWCSLTRRAADTHLSVARCLCQR